MLLISTAGETVGRGHSAGVVLRADVLRRRRDDRLRAGLLRRHRRDDLLAAAAALGAVALAWFGWSALAPGLLPGMPATMGVVFVVCLVAGVPIAFVLALTTLVFVWAGDMLPGEFFAQQTARGIDNFVLLAVPFFILVGYLMEANGMSIRIMSLLQRGVGRLRGGLDVAMVLSMVVFSGISGSKMADVAAVGSVLVPAARKSGQKPGDAVALLAASAVMAETIPPCVNLIILGFVTNLSIGGLFMAGLLPSAVMALALIVMAVVLGKRAKAPAIIGRGERQRLGHGQRRHRRIRPDRPDLRRIPVRLRHRDGDFGVRGPLCAGGRRRAVPGNDLARHRRSDAQRHGEIRAWCCSLSPPRRRCPTC